MTLARITGFRLVTGDLDRLARFYVALGFVAGERRSIGEEELRLLGLAGTGERLTMLIGPSRVDLDRFDPPGRAYPPEANTADLIFQHLAIVTDDAASAWARAEVAGATPISHECPVTLPASSGGVTAVKFRDPDGHPLEFLQFPPGKKPDWAGSGILGIDHSAISIADLAESRRFYADNGLAQGKATLNQGPTQVALDGMDGAAVDIVPMIPETKPPHLELLAYRQPRGRPHAPLAADDVGATRVVWNTGKEALVRDPDGHLHQLTR